VCAHLFSPRARGLFSTAIVESGFYRGFVNTTTSTKFGEDFATLVCPNMTGTVQLECLRGIDGTTLLKMQAKVCTTVAIVGCVVRVHLTMTYCVMVFQCGAGLLVPAVDGLILPQIPGEMAAQNGLLNNVCIFHTVLWSLSVSHVNIVGYPLSKCIWHVRYQL